MGSGGGIWESLDTMSVARLNQKTNVVVASEPATMYPGMVWFDTTANTLKVRNAANTAWIVPLTSNPFDQSLNTTDSPTFAGLTLTAFSGFVKATAGVLSAAALTDSDIPNDITLTNITQITNRSHASLSDVGILSHATIDSYLDQAVKQASSPTFAGLTITPNFITLGSSAHGVLLKKITDNVLTVRNQADTGDGTLQAYIIDITGTGIVFNTDVNLYRVSANILATDDNFQLPLQKQLIFGDSSWGMILVPASGEEYGLFKFKIWGDNNDRWQFETQLTAPTVVFSISNVGTLLFGSAEDTNLYRASANILKTDDEFDAASFRPIGANAWIIFQDATKLYLGVSGITNGLTIDTSGNAESAGYLKTSQYLYLGADTNLHCSAANVLKTDDWLELELGFGIGVQYATVDGWYRPTYGMVIAHTEALGSVQFMAHPWGYPPSFTWRSALDNSIWMTLTGAGQLQLPITGSSGGLLIGGDANLYRSAANILATDDALTVGGTLTMGAQKIATTYFEIREHQVDVNCVYLQCMRDNGASSFAVIPSHDPFANHKANISLFTTDYVADATNYERLMIWTEGTNYYVDSVKGGTGSLRPIKLCIAGTSAISIATTGIVTLSNNLIISDPSLLQIYHLNNDLIFKSRAATGDTEDRFQIYAGGALEWGSGAAGADVVLARESANLLRLYDSLQVDVDLTVNGNVYFPNLPAADDLDDLAVIGAIKIKPNGFLDLTDAPDRFKGGNAGALVGLLLGCIKQLNAKVERLRRGGIAG